MRIDVVPADLLVVVDTETTGLSESDWARVIEIGAVAINSRGREASCFESMVKPDVLDDRAKKALGVNRIEIEAVLTAPPCGLVARDFYNWLRGLDGVDDGGRIKVQMTAYNAKFDSVMVGRMYRVDPEFRWAECLAIRATRLMGPLGVLKPTVSGDSRRVEGSSWLRPSLVAACEFFGVEKVEPRHRAISDARTAAGLKVAMDRVVVENLLEGRTGP